MRLGVQSVQFEMRTGLSCEWLKNRVGFYRRFTAVLPSDRLSKKKTSRKWLVSIRIVGRHDWIRTSDP